MVKAPGTDRRPERRFAESRMSRRVIRSELALSNIPESLLSRRLCSLRSHVGLVSHPHRERRARGSFGRWGLGEGFEHDVDGAVELWVFAGGDGGGILLDFDVGG